MLAQFHGMFRALCELSVPTIAVVRGQCLGGGMELASYCSWIFANPTARFGQPEINLGIIPGWGGTQRLTRAIGKSKAMEMILTGSMITAEQAESAGLVSQVFPEAELLDKSLEIAATIASKSLPVSVLAKEAVNSSQMGIHEGLTLERKIFHSLFSLEDQKEGMQAFIEKRAPEWKHK